MLKIINHLLKYPGSSLPYREDPACLRIAENSPEIVQQIQKNYFLSSNRSLTISPIFHKLHQDGIATGFQSMSEFVVSVIKEPNSHGTLNLLSDLISVNDACLQNKVCNLLRGIVKRSGTAS